MKRFRNPHRFLGGLLCFVICFSFLIPSCVKKTGEELHKNLIPTTPGRSPNYWCTWAAQNYMEGYGKKELDPILWKVAGIYKFHSDHINELPRSKLRGINTKISIRNRSKLRGIIPQAINQSIEEIDMTIMK